MVSRQTPLQNSLGEVGDYDIAPWGRWGTDNVMTNAADPGKDSQTEATRLETVPGLRDQVLSLRGQRWCPN